MLTAKEVNLFNAKLLYTNKIFKAKNLTESQKVKVLAAFDKAASVKEAKLVFETLSEGMKETKKTVNESMLRGSASRAVGVAEKKPILEVNALMEKWKLTSKEVSDYAKKIADGVTPSDIWPTPGNQAAKSWRDALAALNAYLAAAGVKLAPTMPTPTAPTPGPTPGPTPAQIATVAKKIESSTGSAASAFGTLTTEEKAVLGGYKPFVGAQTTFSAPTISGASSVGLGTSGTGSQLPAGVTINMTVQGSVTSENDLVASIRNGLLQGQNNGQAIVKSAVAI